jgi:nucleoside-diphosphate-sugar epimerase
MKNILILGMDGYIGWSLAMHLAKAGHTVAGIDNYWRRRNVRGYGADSATPILEMPERLRSFKEFHGREIKFREGDLLDYSFVSDVVRETRPDSIVHLAEQPSAPYSMMNRETAFFTQYNNTQGTLNVLYAMRDFVPEAHLVKLGTMGEYGYDTEFEIPEGFFEIEYKGKRATVPFPRMAGSWYHWSKVHDSNNIMFACRLWGLRSTDVMQGIVYGTRTHEMVDDSLVTRFDFDECFGTVINRYCAEAVIGYPLTPYGAGKQRRGFIDLVDSIQCLRIAIENPASQREYRVFNQLDEVYGVSELAEHVVNIGRGLGLDVHVHHVPNPRVEKEVHQYHVVHERLKLLGFKPTRTISETISIMLQDLMKFKDRIMSSKQHIAPKTTWRQERPEEITSMQHAKSGAAPDALASSSAGIPA